MGQGASVYDKNGQIRIYEHPYSITQKVLQFPWRFHFQYSRWNRFMVFGVLATLPLFYELQKMFRSEGNKKEWVQIRNKRNHTFFDPPKPI